MGWEGVQDAVGSGCNTTETVRKIQVPIEDSKILEISVENLADYSQDNARAFFRGTVYKGSWLLKLSDAELIQKLTELHQVKEERQKLFNELRQLKKQPQTFTVKSKMQEINRILYGNNK